MIVYYDIVRNEFKINDSVYSKNLFDLKFINEEYLEKLLIDVRKLYETLEANGGSAAVVIL